MKTIKENKKVFFLLFLITLLFLIADYIIIYKEYQNYNELVNNKISNIISVDSENKDIAIYNILNGNTSSKSAYLEKYNLDSNTSYISLLNKQMKHNLIVNLLLLFSFEFLCLVIIYKCLKRKDKELIDLTLYLQKVNAGKYYLDIKNNEEGSLSKLKNEIYKITINLKETAENNKITKENLATSIADVSHQIKTPLTSINILLENIADNPKMPEETKTKFLNEINKQLKNIEFLSLAILKLSRFDAGVVEFKKSNINLNKILKDTIDSLEALWEIKNLKINRQGNNDVYFIGDYNWEKEAYQNIIKNSIEALPNNGTINISYEMNSLYTKLVIEDNGPGITPNDLKHLFERFYRGTNAKKGSFGIGLNLAKNIIETDNGYITVDSQINKGTKFIIKYITK